MRSIFVLNGQSFHVWSISIQRNFRIAEGENSGMTVSGRKRRDIIGTYYNYTLSVDPSEMDRNDYDKLYEMLSAPVESHTLTVPYGQGTITYEAYITAGDDKVELVGEDGDIAWGDLTVQFEAMEPQRR